MAESAAYTHWGADHCAAIGLTIIGAISIVVWGRRSLPADDRRLRRAAAVVLLANEAAAWVVAVAQGHPRMPLQLCDLALLLMVWALWTLKRPVMELAYYWVMAGSVQAVLTPDLARGFPHYWWIKFFITHTGVVLSALYLLSASHVRLSYGSVWRAWVITNAYAACVGLINWAWGTNYGYLAHKPEQPSLLDYFGPWPWYILGLEAAALVSFHLYFGLAKAITRGRSYEPV